MNNKELREELKLDDKITARVNDVIKICNSDRKVVSISKLKNKGFLSLIERYKDECIRIVEKVSGMLLIELDSESIFYNSSGKEEFTIEKETSLMPEDTIIVVNKDKSINEKQAKYIVDNCINTFIKKVGDNNIIIPKKYENESTLVINKNGWVLEYSQNAEFEESEVIDLFTKRESDTQESSDNDSNKEESIAESSVDASSSVIEDSYIEPVGFEYEDAELNLDDLNFDIEITLPDIFKDNYTTDKCITENNVVEVTKDTKCDKNENAEGMKDIEEVIDNLDIIKEITHQVSEEESAREEVNYKDIVAEHIGNDSDISIIIHNTPWGDGDVTVVVESKVNEKEETVIDNIDASSSIAEDNFSQLESKDIEETIEEVADIDVSECIDTSYTEKDTITIDNSHIEEKDNIVDKEDMSVGDKVKSMYKGEEIEGVIVSIYNAGETINIRWGNNHSAFYYKYVTKI